jgi:hypothetical protein
LTFVANTIAEVRGFIHIQPYPIKSNVALEICKPFAPPGRSNGVEEIRVSSIVRPNFSCEDVTRRSLDKDILVNSIIVWLIIPSLSHCNSSINDWDIAQVLSLDLVDPISKSFEIDWINGKVFIIVHIVNIRPHSVERKDIIRIVAHHFFEFVQVGIAPSALVPA